MSYSPNYNYNNGPNVGPNNAVYNAPPVPTGPQFDLAAQTLTLSPETLEKLTSLNVRTWTTADVVIWLADIFNGAEVVAEYEDHFRKNGVRGIDLLSLDEKQMAQLGITSPLHVGRVRNCVAQLQYQQWKIDDSGAKEKAQKEAEETYFRMETLFAELTVNPEYKVPERMEKWEPIDVFIFIKRPEHQEWLHMFVKPLALNKINGEELIKLGEQKDPLQLKVGQALVGRDGKPIPGKKNFDLPGLVCEDRDIERFQIVVTKAKKNCDELRKRRRDEDRRILDQKLFKIDRNRLNKNLIVGEGNFSQVFIGTYYKKKVVIKMLKSQDPTKKGGKGGKNGKKKKKVKKLDDGDGDDIEDIKKRKVEVLEEISKGVVSKDAKAKAEDISKIKEKLREEDIVYEATMTARAASNGVVKLFGYDTNNEKFPASIVLEYLCNDSVEKELRNANHPDPEKANLSIFSPNHEKNELEEGNGVKEPVLLQVVRIARDVAISLAEVHAKGIIHLDIAARNILLDAGKRPKISDFGLAVMATDMKEMYEFRKKKIAEFGSDSHFDLKYRQAVADEQDEDLWRKHKMQMQTRANRWMPDHVVKFSANQKPPYNPELTPMVDVYSFGCFMLELVTGKYPHHELNEDEVRSRKEMGRGTPAVPPGLNATYQAIMTSCWERDKQQPMKDVAQSLKDLHRDLFVGNLKKTDYYDAFKTFAESNVKPTGESLYSAAIHGGPALLTAPSHYSTAGGPSTSAYSSAPSSGSHYSSPDAAPQAPRETFTPNYAQYTIKPNRIRFDGQFPDGNIPIVAEWLSEGAKKDSLEAALKCAFHLREHTTIENIMVCIKIENDANQIDIIRLCLEYLSKLAEDEHGYTDEEETWHRLCRSILYVAKFADLELQSCFKAIVLKEALAAFASILNHKTVDEFEDEDAGSDRKELKFATDICNLAIATFSQFPDDTRVVEMAAASVSSLATLSIAVISKLHKDGTVALLVKAMLLHRNDDKLVLNCVKALEKFPLIDLVDPRAEDRKLREEKDRRNLPPLPAPETQAATWGLVFDAVNTIVKAASRGNVAVNNVEEKEDETDEKKVTKLELLKSCLQMMFKSCEDSIGDLRQIERFFYTVTPEVIDELVYIMMHFPAHFYIQEGAIGVLSNVLSTGSPLFLPEYDVRKKGYKPANIVVPLASTEKQRLKRMLELDPKFTLLLQAMTNFSTNDQIHKSFEVRVHNRDSLEGRYQREGVVNTMTRGANYSTDGRDGQGDRYGYAAPAVGYGDGGRYANVGAKYGGTGGGHYGGGVSYGATAGYGKGTYGYKNVYADAEEDSDGLDYDSDLDDGKGSFVPIFSVENDADGNIITAANLQRSGAMIIGIASATYPEVKDNLINTTYNELIMVAFENFDGDVNLIRYGCNALFSTCHGHARNQRMLYERNIFKVLCKCLEKYNSLSFWLVVDAIVSTLIALLEPSPEVYNMSTVKYLLSERDKITADHTQVTNTATGLKTEQELRSMEVLKKTSEDRKKEFDGYKIAIAITQRAVTSIDNERAVMSLLQKLALYVAEFQMFEECHPIAANFLKLITSVTYWLPHMLSEWESSNGFVDLIQSKRLVKEVYSRFKEFLRVWQAHQNFRDKPKREETASASADQSSKKEGDEESKKDGAPGTPGAPATPTGPTPPGGANASGNYSSQLNKLSNVQTVTNKKEQMLAKQAFMPLERVTLLQFVQLATLFHEHQPSVLSAALSINTASFRRSCYPEDLVLGAEIPYMADRFLVKDSNGDAKICRGPFIHRMKACQSNLIKYCLSVKVNKIDNPILARYSLWLIILMISQSRLDVMSVFDPNHELVQFKEQEHAAISEVFNAGTIADEVAKAGMLAWALELANRYENYYSLQCMATVFLIWMENHGRLFNNVDKLPEIKKMVMRNLNRPVDSYTPLAKEGHDAYMLGQDISAFGLLSLHSSQLLRLIETRLPPEIGDFSGPSSINASGGAAACGEVWDCVCRPRLVECINVEAEEDASHKKINMYAIQVTWSIPEPKWKITARFVRLHELDKALKLEFVHLGDITKGYKPAIGSYTPIGDLRKGYVQLPPRKHRIVQMMNNQAVFLEARKQQIQHWLAAMTSNRVTKNCRIFQRFCQIPSTCQIRTVRMLPSLHLSPAINKDPPVQTILYCMPSQLMFVGRGIPKTSITLVSKTMVRGSLSVFRLVDSQAQGTAVWVGAGYKMVAAASLTFNVGVMSVAWDINRRNVIVGLSTGPILFYFLSHDASTLTYCSELDCHNNKIPCNLIYEPQNNTLLTASEAGTVVTFDAVAGQASSQFVAKGGSAHSVAYARLEKLAFIGTKTGKLLICDLNSKTTVKEVMLSQNIPALQKLDNKGDVCVVYVEETRLLFATHFHEIYVWILPPVGQISAFNYHVSTTYAKFFLSEASENVAKICSLLVFHYGNYICVSTTRGNAVLFDMSEQTGLTTYSEAIEKEARYIRTATASTSTASAEVNYLSTTNSALVPWNEIIKRNNTALRDWLRANSVDATLTLTRADLIALVMQKAPPGKTKDEVAALLRPATPRTDPLLTWNLNVMEYVPELVTSVDGADPTLDEGSTKSVRQPWIEPAPYIVSSCFIDEINCIAFGTRLGKIEIVSIADFLPPLTREEKRDYGHIRTQLGMRDVNQAGIAGSTKSSRGKRHDLASGAN